MAKVKKAVKAIKAVKAKKLSGMDVKEAQKRIVTKAEAKGKKRQKQIKERPKPKPDPLRPAIVMQMIVETLQSTSFDGEFDLPSMLMRQLDKSHPDYNQGLHRKYYVPITYNVHFYPKDSDRALMVFGNQATSIISALIGEGIPRREKEFDPPFCREHK